MSAFKELLNKDRVKVLAAHIQKQHKSFNLDGFLKSATTGLSELEFKGRARHIATVLSDYLPQNFDKACGVLEAALAPETDPDAGELMGDDDSQGLAGFIVWPLTEYIVQNGLAHPERALAALNQMTRRFTAEFAIRRFIIEHQQLSLRTLKEWRTSDSAHVRRLVTEGSRPRLPWGERLNVFIQSPQLSIDLIAPLSLDTSTYVRRSVANHMNDISKDHPELAVKIIKEWLKHSESKTATHKHVQALGKHALRGLFKAGHAPALKLYGFKSTNSVKIKRLEFSPATVRIGHSTVLNFDLVNTSKSAQTLMVDYVVHLVRQGGRTGKKVFKLKTLTLAGLERAQIQKSISFKPVTVRRYYPGAHKIEVLVNGAVVASSNVKVVKE